ncbi:MAG: thioesterase [Anaerococcus sp.]|nr:thioesterase [Peptoniphilaceae bacterium]MDY2919021.1 thioesterase [Anaerococcus sp.]
MRKSRTYKITNILTDSQGYLSLRNLSALMSDVGYLQEVDVEDEVDMGRYRWIVYKWDIEILEPIKLNDEVTITTIPTHMNKFYAYREFLVERQGYLVVRARADFMLIDIDRLRPVKIPVNIAEAYGHEDESLRPPKLKYSKDLDFVKDIQVRRADIDTNLHVNNGVYFDYVKEITGVNDKDIEYINLVYRNEIRNKDFVKGYAKREGDIIEYALRSTEDDTVYSLGKIKLHV